VYFRWSSPPVLILRDEIPDTAISEPGQLRLLLVQEKILSIIIKIGLKRTGLDGQAIP
jgi:hypothetical protein